MQARKSQLKKIYPATNLQVEKKQVIHSIRKIAISTTMGIEIFKLSNIIHCEAKGSYCLIKCQKRGSMLVSKTLKCVEQAIQSKRFMRIHQSHLVCLHHIQSIHPAHVLLENGDRVPVSRSNRSKLMERMNDLLTYL